MLNIEKIKKKVLAKYPTAKVAKAPGGGYHILVGDYIPADDHLLPPTESIDEAWSHVLLSMKTTQNFNRTHPDRLELKDIEHKINRLNCRRINGRKRNEII